MKRIDELRFTNTFSRLLPEGFYARVAQTPLEGAELIDLNPEAAALIELDPAEAGRPEFLATLNGERPLPGADPVAALYAGHQFGHYVPQLGDGRALLLGEVETSGGERWELQMKGSGPTPFSRSGDGRAVLRSSIREYLCSEAMAALGVPTTRALCLIGSREEVYREQAEPGALILRMAPSHIRFGSFEVFYYRGQYERLRQLADHTIRHHFPELWERPDRYLAFYREVVERTARLMAKWQHVGFTHGVMNTDNFSVLGLTLDYGPFGFVDGFERRFVCNHSDYAGRYAFDQQPDIGLWNLSCLGQALLPLLGEEPEAAAEIATEAYRQYIPAFRRHYGEGLAAKLGLAEYRHGDGELGARLLDLMEAGRVDYTNLFRALASFNSTEGVSNSALRDRFPERESFDAWAVDYAARLRTEGRDPAERAAAMQRVNPKYVLRNYLAQQAIDRAHHGDHDELRRLLTVLRRPFDEQPEHDNYAAEPPDWAVGIALSCSS